MIIADSKTFLVPRIFRNNFLRVLPIIKVSQSLIKMESLRIHPSVRACQSQQGGYMHTHTHLQSTQCHLTQY